MIAKSDAIAILKRRIDEISTIRDKGRSPEFNKWRRDTQIAIENIFGSTTRHLKDFNGIDYSPGFWSSFTPDSEFQEAYFDGLDDAEHILSSMIDEIEVYWDTSVAEPIYPGIQHVERICERFHLVVRQLRSRHANRPTLCVEDEYDVQDLLHSLLFLEFNDIRPEEWTPSYAGGSARVDFLLKSESIVVEVKKTRATLGAKELGDQFLIDIGRYQSHHDCRTLLCFVYDPEGRIANPRGLETDLTKKVNELDVRVFIRPKCL